MAIVERWIFYLLVLLLPVQLGKHFWPSYSSVSGIRIDYLSPTIYLTDILLVLLFGCYAYRIFKTIKEANSNDRRSKPSIRQTQDSGLTEGQSKRKIYFISSLVVLFIVVNVLTSSRPLLSLYGAAKLGEFAFLAFYVTKTFRSTFQVQIITILFATSSIFESMLAMLQYINQGSLNGMFYYFGERTFTSMTPGIANASIGGALILRPYGTFPHPNVLAGYLLIGMVLVWGFLFKNTKQWMQVIGAVSLLIGSIALLLTFSRVAILLWILLLLTILVKYLLVSVKTSRSKIIAIAITIVCVVFIRMTPVVHDVVIRFATTSLSDESVTERTELLSTAFTIIKQHPLLGVGLYNFIPAMAPLQKPLPLGLYLQPVHNIFMLVMAETGLIGLGLFIWMLVITIKRIASCELRMKRTFMVLMAIILLTGMFDHYWMTLQQGQLLFAVVLGLGWMRLKKIS
ncbi:MAG TPA: O-antigen ligase family protein [Candidatus Acidoferrales bacterium]|nr:O-antigen ligase family protein [Candidatus Acidoferrales bacterium]